MALVPFFLPACIARQARLAHPQRSIVSSCTDKPRSAAAIYFIVLAATAITVSINIIEFLAFAGALLIMTLVMLRVYLPAAGQVKRMQVCTASAECICRAIAAALTCL